jgi:hypothetical protein
MNEDAGVPVVVVCVPAIATSWVARHVPHQGGGVKLSLATKLVQLGVSWSVPTVVNGKEGG